MTEVFCCLCYLPIFFLGLYTDGEHVFEGSYDYLQGKNVMRKYESFEGYARSKHMDQQALERLQSRMATDQPDLVIEKTVSYTFRIRMK